jgi:F-box-like
MRLPTQNGVPDHGRPLNNGKPNGHRHVRDSLAVGSDLDATSDSITPHPLGLKPLGNQYLASGRPAKESIGAFDALPDETLVILLEYLDQHSLRQLGYTCRFLYACCRSDDLWKALFLE